MNKLKYVYFDFIELSPKLKNLLEKKTSNMIMDFYPTKTIEEFDNIDFLFDRSIPVDSIKKMIFRNIFDNNIKNVFGFDPNFKINILTKQVFIELNEFLDFDAGQQQFHHQSILHIMHQINNKNVKVIFSKDYKNMILFNEFFNIIFNNNYIYSKPNLKTIENQKDKKEENYFLMTNKYINIKSKCFLADIYFNKDQIYGTIKNSKKQHIFNLTISDNYVINKKYKYENYKSRIKINFNGFIDYFSGIEKNYYTKLNCYFQEYFNPKTKLLKTISICNLTNFFKKNNIDENIYNNTTTHITNNNLTNSSVATDTTATTDTTDTTDTTNKTTSNLRYRGKITQTTNLETNNTNKTIKYGDNIVFKKEENKILIDKLNRTKRKTDEFVIGYKVAKSINDEIRIIKLGIPPDANIVSPIDIEYFVNGYKERCDKAIVMDIQLPIIDTEISVVPNENVAYSYIYEPNSIQNYFEYKIGQEVIPDTFDSNEDIGCSNGIHYYQDRKVLFNIYINI